MSDDTSVVSPQQLRNGFAATGFELVTAGNGEYELPVSDGAKYDVNEQLTPTELRDTVETREYVFIDDYIEESYLSSKVLDAETNEFFHLKLSNNAIYIYPKSEEFSQETFERIVKTIHENVTPIKLTTTNK